MGTRSAWTPERRAKIIRRTKPWELSTGPATEAGKAVSSRNAYAGDWVHEANATMSRVRVATLEFFGRKRWPKGAGRSR